MAIDFDALKGKVSDLAQTGVAKAKEFTDSAVDKGKELSEIGKLKVQNATEQDAIKKAYIEIGKLYFAERGSAPEAPYAALCQQITASNEKIAYNNQRIEDIKSAGKLGDEDVDAIFEETEEPCCCDCETPAEEAPQAPEQDCCCDENQ